MTRRRRPNTERNISHCPPPTSSAVITTSGEDSTGPSAGRLESPGTDQASSPTTLLGFDDEANTALSTNLVTPIASRLMPSPLVIWSARQRTVTSAWSAPVSPPATTAAATPTHGLPVQKAPSV